MRVAIELEFSDDQAADVFRWLQVAPEGVTVYLMTRAQMPIQAPASNTTLAQPPGAAG